MMSKRISPKDKHQFSRDFKTILALSLASNAKGLSQQDKHDIKECIKEKKLHRVIRIIEKKYSDKEWQRFVEAQAAPLLKSYA